VTLDGRRVTGLAPHRLARLGVARSFQECRVFPEYTCMENLRFAGIALGARAEEEEARRLLNLVGLEAYASEPASLLSFGQRRLLEIVGTFLQHPRVLLLDEPAAGVNPALLEVLTAFILRMYEERPSVFLVIEHNMEFIMGLAREIIVMHQGAVLERGDPQAIQASPRVIEAYLG
jgi:ABC-type branched-subunit amino acid transport system ATPase component